MCFVKVFTGAATFLSAEQAFTFGRGYNMQHFLLCAVNSHGDGI